MKRFAALPVVLALIMLGMAWSMAAAQVTMFLNKSAGNVNLSWSGGVGPYEVLRATSPKMTANTLVLDSNILVFSYDDTGAANDDVNLYFYVVSDGAPSAMPNIDITMPCQPFLCFFQTDQRTIPVTGTTNAALVFVNDALASVSGATFTAEHFDGGTAKPGVVLNLGTNIVTAAAKSANEDWAIDQIEVFRSNGNDPPTISIQVSDRGAAAVAADGAVIYDPTPELEVAYNDPPSGVIDPNDVRIYVNGTEKTRDCISCFSVTATSAQYQVPTDEAWSPGNNFVYATVQDGNPALTGYSMSASAHVVLRNPTILSFAPAAEGIPGDSITITGDGFDPTLGNNTVTFNGVPASISSATGTQLGVTVPVNAQTGPVVVTVPVIPTIDERSSAGDTFWVLLASGRSSIGGMIVNPAVSNHVFFTDGGSGGALFEVLGNGTASTRCTIPNPLGVAVDSLGAVYAGQQASNPSPLYRYQPGVGCSAYVADTRVSGDTTASVGSIAVQNLAGSVTAYIDDYDNTKIKRVDSGVTVIANDGTAANSGMALRASDNKLFFTEFDELLTIPVPGGGSSTVAKVDPAGHMHGLALDPTGSLLVARADAGTVSWLDPNNPANPFWDLAAGLSTPRAVALGEEVPPGQVLPEGFVVAAEPTRVFRLPRPAVVLSDDADAPLPSKLVVDFTDPTVDCVTANTFILKVQFAPSSLIPDTLPNRQLVTWEVEDPDDPSSDGLVDTNGTAGGDNLEMVGSHDRWVEVTTPITYGMTGVAMGTTVQTKIVDGVSKVRFRASCHPGDNYRFHAKVTVPIYGTLEGVSNTVTIWRRLHIESDSMGVAIGPFQDDDAVIGDIPDPILDFIAEAFLPAYVDVVLPTDTGQDTGDVRFRYNVGLTNPELNAQANMGRSVPPSSSHWVVYVQAGYEGPISADNDPDGEVPPPPFMSPIIGLTGLDEKNSLTFVETIRDRAEQFHAIDMQYVLASITLHELAHQFGLADETGCIMDSFPVLNPVFCPLHLRLIRGRRVPGMMPP